MRKRAMTFLAVVLLLASATISDVAAISGFELDALRHVYEPWDPREPRGCGIGNVGGGVNATPSKTKDDNAKIIMGLAKTMGVGQRGALIALMAGLTESGLKIYSNRKNVPISASYPNIQADGSDHNSVGIFQMQPDKGWSTYSKGGPSALTNKDAVFQDMDPASSTEIFFGVPPGSTLPPGLINPAALTQRRMVHVPNWQTKDPGAVAQAVEVSAFPDRYNQHRAEAESLISRLWDSSPNIPPPIPYNSVAAGPGEFSSGTSTAGCVPQNDAGGTGVSPDGFVFPLRTTKARMTSNEYWSYKCKNPINAMGALGTVARRTDLCHHDYLAADIQAQAGTQVLSPRPGRVLRLKSSPIQASTGCIGSNMAIYSDKALGGDGNTYYLAHLGNHEAAVGDVVKAGELVATIGNAPSNCFHSHLHIDASPITQPFGRGNYGTRGPLVNIQPALVAAYEKLPDSLGPKPQ